MRVVTAIALLALVVPTTGAADDPKAAAKKLEGTYEVLEFIEGGKPKPEKDDLESFVVKGDEMIVKSRGREEPAKFTLDPSKTPGHIDIMPGKDKVLKGIYMTKETDAGLELTIAFAEERNMDRPKDFKGAGKNEIVIKLLRKKAK